MSLKSCNASKQVRPPAPTSPADGIDFGFWILGFGLHIRRTKRGGHKSKFQNLKSKILLPVLLTLCPILAHAQAFTSSNLPIFVIDTGGQVVVDEPKITAHLGLVDNGEGVRNHIDDPFNAYDGFIGIEVRGSSTRMFPKQAYAFETRDENGENLNVPLLGMPEENDWILYAPYSDKSMLRNVLTYHLARRMGRYASRTRFCEVVINGDYRGVYVLLEKVKRDNERVDIEGLTPEDRDGDAVTGGYIIKLDKFDGAEQGGWASDYPPPANANRQIFYQYHEPKASEITPEQTAYIQGYMRDFENLMASSTYADSTTGYPARIDVDAFADFFLLNELSKNVDGYRLSTFLNKDRDSNDGRLVVGPIWDFNLAFGNADYYNGAQFSGFQVDFSIPQDTWQVPFWWGRLLEDEAFQGRLRSRWDHLRAGPLQSDSLFAFLDTQVALLEEAQVRNFVRWPVLGLYVWPNAFVGQTYAQELTYLKDWLLQRLAWLDFNIGTRQISEGPKIDTFSAPFPNPFTTQTQVTVSVSRVQRIRLAVYDILGREVALLYDSFLQDDQAYTFTLDDAALPSGVYFIHLRGATFIETRRVVLVR